MTTAQSERQSTILLVEDDRHTAEIVRLYLEREGHSVLVASDGSLGLRLAKEKRPALIVLDLMLPGMDGLEVCRNLRAEANSVPVIMLTARVDEHDKLAGLDLGADDYVTKPFSPRELAARVRAVLRRSGKEVLGNGEQVLTHGALKVDLGSREVLVDNKAVRLTPTEFKLLVYLMRSPGQVIPRERIIERVFGYDFDGLDRTLDTHVSNLRRKLELASPETRLIETIYGIGYRFVSAA